jgi:hypothetical protein
LRATAPRAPNFQESRLTLHADVAAPVAQAPGPEHPNQFALLAQRRFAPFFWTQFLAPATTTCSSSRSPSW